MHVLLLVTDFIWIYIKEELCFGLQNPAICAFDMLEQPILSQQVKIHPPCLQWQVVLHARKASSS